MRIIVLLFCLASTIQAWSINDIYTKLVNGNRGEKKQDTAKSSLKGWSQQANAPSNYEVQSYDVETFGHVKKNVPAKPFGNSHGIKPTEGITKFHTDDSLMSFHKKYGGVHSKPQVSAWTEWTHQDDPLRASKKHNPPKPYVSRVSNERDVGPTIQTKLLNPELPEKKENVKTPTQAHVKLSNNTAKEKHEKSDLESRSPANQTYKQPAPTTAVVAPSTGTRAAIKNIEFNQPEPRPGKTLAAHTKHQDGPAPTEPVMLASDQNLHQTDKQETSSKEPTAKMIKEEVKKLPTDAITKSIDESPTDSVTASMNGGSSQSIAPLASQEQDPAKLAEVEKEKSLQELPDVRGLLDANFNQQTFRLHDCHLDAVAEACGVKVVVAQERCEGRVSFTALLARLLNNVDLSIPTNELIVHGKFDANSFQIDRCKQYITFNLTCRELLDIIPNKLRISKARVTLSFNYENIPKSIAHFDIKTSGVLDLNFRSRRLNVDIDKPFSSTLFKIEMTATDLELPEFTRLFTEAEISTQELPPDLATLVTSSLRNPRINGLYDESGAFEFVASAKSPASIFPSQPNVYVIVQKPRLGKVVFGLIASFESAMYRSFLSSILNQDLSNIPLFNDVRTDMALGISPDGLFVVKDDNFNKEVGSLFNTGKTIKKGLTIKARLPIRKMLQDLAQKKNTPPIPETVLINVEVKGNKMHIEFPDDFQVPLSEIPELFAQRGQDMNFPKQTKIDDTTLNVKSYEIDNIDKKSLSVYFGSGQPMKIGSLMSLNNVGATLRRDELSKWSFVANGDCKLGTTSVNVQLTSKNEGFVISSNPSSIRSGLLVDLLDQKRQIITPEMKRYHMEDFVIEDFKVTGALSKRNVIRLSGKPSLYGVDDSKIEFVATEEDKKEDQLGVGILMKDVNLDQVFGRMLDKKMKKSSWATGVNIGLIVSDVKNGGDMQFETEGLARTKIMPGAHLRCLLMRPEASLCKGDSLCRVLSEEMPRGSAFHLQGSMDNGVLRLNAPINDVITLSKALKLTDASLRVNVEDSVNIHLLASLGLRGVGVPFTGDMRVDSTGQLQLDMKSKRSWIHPFGLQNVHFSNNNLTATFEPGRPLPVFEIKSKMIFGKDPDDATKSIETVSLSKINSQDPSKNSFTSQLRDISFERLASACGTKKPLSRFQQEALFLDDGVLSFEQNNKRDDIETARESNDTDFNYKGDLKVQGRMRILGQTADYTIKMLHQESQLLTEVWLPDIGVNQGMLTIRAGLKQQRTDVPTPNGPTLLIRMDPFMNSAVIVGKVSTLGFSRISAIKVEDGGFSAKIFGNLPGNVNSDIALHSDYVENIQNADFKASSCLPIQHGTKASLIKALQDTATKTKRTLISAEERVTTTEKIYETTKAMIDKNKKRSSELISDIRQRSDVMSTLRKGIKKHCVKDCGDSCMGLPSWKRSGIALAGRNAIGAPSWDGCKKKIPDLNCITRCLGRKVIENVKANNKQAELQVTVPIMCFLIKHNCDGPQEKGTFQDVGVKFQGLMGQLADTKRSLQDARSLVERARKLVDSTLDGLEKVNNQIKVGVDISKFLNEGKTDQLLSVREACFKDSLNNAERSLVKFDVDVDSTNDTKRFEIEAALDGNLEQSIAEAIANQLYPGYFEFSKKLEQVKVLLSNLDGEKAEIEKEIEKTGDATQAEQKSQIIWTSEEDEFRKLAYGELPRFTLSDDETIHAFEEKSIWEIAPTNDPMFDQAPGDNQIITNKLVNPSAFSDEFNKMKSNCGKIRSSVNRYGDIVNPLSEFTENFLQEKIMFYRQKNRRLADLRMIDDQIKSDCFLENCTMEDMGNALSYLARARDGTLKWSNVIESQIESQNKAALGYFSKRTAEIIEADKGVTLRQYIAKVKEVAVNAMKKSDIGEKSDTDDKIQKLAKELHSLLVGVRNSEELSKVAPKIFQMKRQIQTLKRNKIPCTDKPHVEPHKDDAKLRAVKVSENNEKKNATTQHEVIHHKPTRKEVITTTTKKKVTTPKRTTVSQPTETENPVLKDTVMRYDKINNNAYDDKHKNHKRTHATNDKYTETELVDPIGQYPQSQYYMEQQQQQQQQQGYNQYPYWDQYLK